MALYHHKFESHLQFEDLYAEIPPTSEKLPKAVAQALLHYDANNVTSQQTAIKINITVRLLGKQSPNNMLVFRVRCDNLLWMTLTHGGQTIFWRKRTIEWGLDARKRQSATL